MPDIRIVCSLSCSLGRQVSLSQSLCHSHKPSITQYTLGVRHGSTETRL